METDVEVEEGPPVGETLQERVERLRAASAEARAAGRGPYALGEEKVAIEPPPERRWWDD